MNTPRIDAVLCTIQAQIDRAPTSGPVTMEHIEMIGAWIEALGAEGKKLERELAELRELHGRQLAAISVACLSNTPESAAAQRIDRGNECWTAAYSDAARAVEREMALRSELESVKQNNAVSGQEPAR